MCHVNEGLGFRAAGPQHLIKWYVGIVKDCYKYYTSFSFHQVLERRPDSYSARSAGCLPFPIPSCASKTCVDLHMPNPVL